MSKGARLALAIGLLVAAAGIFYYYYTTKPYLFGRFTPSAAEVNAPPEEPEATPAP